MLKKVAFALSTAAVGYVVTFWFSFSFPETNGTKKRPLFDGSSRPFTHFLHVTDTHINAFKTSKGHKNFKRFFKNAEAIKPRFVVNSGDLTDSAVPVFFNVLNRGVVATEDWTLYKNTVEAFVEKTRIPYLDVPGNHDYFGVYKTRTRFSEKDGILDPTFYPIDGDLRYLLVLIDPCPVYGTQRMFNFFGHVSGENVEKIKRGIEERDPHSVVMVGHYPLNFFTVGSHGLLERVNYYMCGHLHDIVGLSRDIYSAHESLVELELADMKRNAVFRICGLWNGRLSFTDVRVDDFPYVLFYNPSSENTVRALKPEGPIVFHVFSEDSYSVKVYVDDVEKRVRRIEENIYQVDEVDAYKTIRVDVSHTYDTKSVVLSLPSKPVVTWILRVSFPNFVCGGILTIFCILVYTMTKMSTTGVVFFLFSFVYLLFMPWGYGMYSEQPAFQLFRGFYIDSLHLSLDAYIIGIMYIGGSFLNFALYQVYDRTLFFAFGVIWHVLFSGISYFSFTRVVNFIDLIFVGELWLSHRTHRHRRRTKTIDTVLKNK